MRHGASAALERSPERRPAPCRVTTPDQDERPASEGSRPSPITVAAGHSRTFALVQRWCPLVLGKVLSLP